MVLDNLRRLAVSALLCGVVHPALAAGEDPRLQTAMTLRLAAGEIEGFPAA